MKPKFKVGDRVFFNEIAYMLSGVTRTAVSGVVSWVNKEYFIEVLVDNHDGLGQITTYKGLNPEYKSLFIDTYIND